MRRSSRAAAMLAACLCIMSGRVVHAALSNISLFNNAQYQQTSTSAPTAPFGYFFSFGGAFQNAGDFNAASASYPGTANKPVTINGTSFSFQSSTISTLSGIHTLYPLGVYTMTVTNTNTQATQSASIN